MFFVSTTNTGIIPRLLSGSLGVSLLLAIPASTFAASFEADSKTGKASHNKALIATLRPSVTPVSSSKFALPSAPLKAPFIHAPKAPQSPVTAPAYQMLNIEDVNADASVSVPLKSIPEKPPEINPATQTALNVMPMAPVPRRAPKIVINIPARQLTLYNGDMPVKSYPVGVGRAQFPTPLGKFEVIHKVVNPGWENPYLAAGQMRIRAGADNPLGTRWIGFKEDGKGEYGVHGTDNPASVGQYSSHGCVRMFVKQAEELYDRVPMGTPVEVIYQPVVIQQKGQQLFVTVYPDALRKGMPSLAGLQSKLQAQYPGSTINMAQLKHALLLPSQKSVLVGTLAPAETTAITEFNDNAAMIPVNNTSAPEAPIPTLDKAPLTDFPKSALPLPSVDMFNN